MNQQHHPFAHAGQANSAYGAFPGLVGLTEPFTDLVSGAISALRGLRGNLRENASRRRTLDALNRLDRRMLTDIGLQPADLAEVASRKLSLDELERRRNANSWRQRSRLDIALQSRRSAVNDERFSLVA